MAGSKKMVVFWVVVPCNLVEVDRHFRGVCLVHHQGNNNGGNQLRNALPEFLEYYTQLAVSNFVFSNQKPF